jgi:YD repeat-containing protein
MKRCFYALSLFLLLTIAHPALGQEAPTGIKVTSTLHDDGSRTDLQTDYDSLTAESKTYSASKKLLQSATYTINAQGQLLEGIAYNAKGQVGGQVAFKYDAQGRMSEQLDKSANGTPLRRLVFYYDANGRVSGLDTYDGQGNLLQASGSSINKKKTRSDRK